MPAEQAAKIRRILSAIDEANEPEEVALFPGRRLHRLTGELEGFWSVTVTGNWRVIFRFEDGNASELDFLDYH